MRNQDLPRGTRVVGTAYDFKGKKGTVIGSWSEGMKGNRIGGASVVWDDHPDADSKSESKLLLAASHIPEGALKVIKE